ncbi:MAG TPA: hypothetical protein VJQ51_13125, partial [Burkholderiales bacterium]|nr:hypothetical protein [Burkholderiales bacterium]
QLDRAGTLVADRDLRAEAFELHGHQFGTGQMIIHNEDFEAHAQMTSKSTSIQGIARANRPLSFSGRHE